MPEQPERVVQRVPAHVPEHVSGHVPEPLHVLWRDGGKLPDHAHQHRANPGLESGLERVPWRVSVHVLEHAPRQVLEHALEHVPQHLSVYVLERVPERVPEHVSGHVREQLRVLWRDAARVLNHAHRHEATPGQKSGHPMP